MHISDLFFRFWNSFRARSYHSVYLPYLRRQFKCCGNNVVIDTGSRIAGKDHISIGSNVYIGPEVLIYSTIAEVKIGNYINMGPKVTIITGDHRTDVVGKYMYEVNEKLPENDKDVIIEDDVWIGTGVIILKGVTIGTGSVVAAGAVVTKDIEPYIIYINSNKQKPRFTEEERLQHIKEIKNKL